MEPQRHNPCSDLESDLHQILREVMRMQIGHGLDYDSRIMERAREHAQRRVVEAERRREEALRELEELEAELLRRAVEEILEEEADLERVLEELEMNEERRGLMEEIEELESEPRALTREDLDNALSDLERRGLIENSPKALRLTSKGARALGRAALERILENLSRRGLGPHTLDKPGEGPWKGSAIRSYEHGDPYERIDIESSLISALERGGSPSDLRLKDLKVYESKNHARLHLGIIVDESGSMNRDGKVEAALEAALALSELMRLWFPDDRLTLIAFSEEVRRLAPWQLPRISVPMKFTDMRAALRAFRLESSHEAGERQAYLITDSAPNYQDGAYIGFEAALKGVLREARRYREEGIILNILMLDEDDELRRMARALARESLGRVFFTNPRNLGEAVVEDFLNMRRA
ncbi:VWA domain-containing protein [Candidatus Bathyarchaeota archaeon]|nr:VWA domain-containing protein [Candidatus Bathyarchaeota archaeon]